MERDYPEHNSTAISRGPDVNVATCLVKAAAALENAAQAMSKASEALYAATHVMQATSGDTGDVSQPIVDAPVRETNLAHDYHSNSPTKVDTRKAGDEIDMSHKDEPENTDFFAHGESLLGHCTSAWTYFRAVFWR